MPGSGADDDSAKRGLGSGLPRKLSSGSERLRGSNVRDRSFVQPVNPLLTGRGSAPTWPDALTAQELHIARLAAEGLTNREIGERLFASVRSTEQHSTHSLGAAARTAWLRLQTCTSPPSAKSSLAVTKLD